MQETQEPWLQFLGQEDPLEEEMAAHSSILAWRIPWTEAPGELWDGPWDHKRSDMTEQLRTRISLTCQHRPLFPLLKKKKKMEKEYMFKDRNPDFCPEPSAGLALIYLLNKHFIEVLSINI